VLGKAYALKNLASFSPESAFGARLAACRTHHLTFRLTGPQSRGNGPLARFSTPGSITTADRGVKRL